MAAGLGDNIMEMRETFSRVVWDSLPFQNSCPSTLCDATSSVSHQMPSKIAEPEAIHIEPGKLIDMAVALDHSSRSSTWTSSRTFGWRITRSLPTSRIAWTMIFGTTDDDRAAVGSSSEGELTAAARVFSLRRRVRRTL